MVDRIIAKRVELTELFYDLVFVYAISKVTGLLHHIHPETAWLQFLTFAIVMIVFINTWMVETVFTNRFGRNSIKDILFFMIDMALLLFMSNAFTGDIQTWFKPFTLAGGLMSGTLVLQYLIVRFKNSSSEVKRLSDTFVFILTLRATLLIMAALIPFKYGLPVALIGVLFSWLLPGLFNPVMRSQPINFPHLLERMTLLIIITFGETIVHIAEYFTLEKLSIYSVLVFIIVCALFMTYITQFDHYIEEKQVNQTGVRLIYLHYPILFGLILSTVSFDFIESTAINNYFAVWCLYLGIVLIYVGLFLATPYNKLHLRFGFKFESIFYFTTLAGFAISMIFPISEIIILVAAVVAVFNASIFSGYMLKHNHN